MFTLVKPSEVKCMPELADQGELTLKSNAYLHVACFSETTQRLSADRVRGYGIEQNLLGILEQL